MDRPPSQDPALLRRLSRPFTVMGVAALLLLSVPLVLQTAVLLLVGALAPELIQSPLLSGLLTLFTTYGAGVTCFALVLRRCGAGADPEPPAPLSPPALGRWLLISLAVLYLANLATLLVLDVVGILRGRPVTNPVDSMLVMPLWLSFLLLCVAAPLAEEWMFRSLLLRRLRPYGDRFAILASALMFALFHGNFNQYLYAFAVGCVFAYVALNTRCLWQTILLHSAVNFVGGLLPNLLRDGAASAVFSLVVLAVMGLGAALLAAEWRRLRFRPGETALSGRLAWRLFLENPGMVFFFLTSLLLAAASLALI